jgi:DNA primase
MSILVDLANIDLAALIEQETGTVRFGKAAGNGENQTQKGNCPWCGGTDRFAVVNSDPQHFYCGIHGGAGCHKSGDAVTFLRLWHNISFVEACKRLDVEPLKDGESFRPRVGGRVYVHRDRLPCEEWRMLSEYFLHVSQAHLWHEKTGKAAREYLHRRGFTDEVMRERGYGYNPKTIFDRDVPRWGILDERVKAVWLPRGLVIPYFVGADLWKINIRRTRADIQAEEKRTGRTANKYVNIKGGSNPLYRSDTLKPGCPLVIFEGEYNADILDMVLKKAGITNVSVIATGSTGKGRADNWLAKIAKASPILISFDPDGAGARAVNDYWLKVLPQALAWPSRHGDLNDMYLAGIDIVKWMWKGLQIAGSDIAVTGSRPSEASHDGPFNCLACGLDGSQPTSQEFFYDTDGQVFCSKRCEQTYHIRQHPVIVAALQAFGPCSLHVDPPGYTLKNHVNKLQ